MRNPSAKFLPARRAPGQLVVLLASLLGGAAQADQTSGAPSWTFGGFGTLGVVHSDERQADFISNVLKDRGAGYSRSWSADVDSRLGAQLGVSLNRQWSAVLQVVAEQGLDGSYRPGVEWANIKYQASPELSVRLGRIAVPMYLAADYRKAGYAYPWARTPVEVYGAIPISNSDGIDASYRWNTGDLKNVTQFFFGRTDVKVTDTTHAFARRLAGVSHTADYGPATMRISYLTTELTVDLVRELFDGFRQFGPPGAAIAERYQVDHKRATGISVGASYDPGNWFVMGELGRLNAHSFLGDKTALYTSAGYRVHNWTAYLAYGKVRINGANSDPGLALDGLPAALAGAAAALNGGLNGLLSTMAIQTTSTLGARWDFRPDMALKLQYDRVLPTGGSSGMLTNVQPGFQSGHAVNVLSTTVDFVF